MQRNSKINYIEILNILEKNNLLREVFDIDKHSAYTGMATDSRQVLSGDVFVCIPGFVTDGHLFAGKAVEKGAGLLIVEKRLNINIPQIVVNNSRKAASLLAKLFFNDPTSQFTLVGITGTNGKTTITTLIEAMLRKNGMPVGFIGTFGYMINGKTFITERTTPDIVELNRIFRQMADAEVKYVVMEVSSHALALDRVYGLHFDAAVFTNLTHEHLDFHKNMNDYAKEKFKLFDNLAEKNGTAFINIDDEYGKKLYANLNCPKRSLSFKKGDITILEYKCSLEGTDLSYSVGKTINKIHTSLIGRYNAFNAVSACEVIREICPEITDSFISSVFDSLSEVPGRLEKVKNSRGIGIYVDYAHTPDALANVLKTLSELKQKRLICVFGAGGERDKTKRPKMLAAALEFSDLAIVTNDNPRNEDPSDIIRDIVGNTSHDKAFWIIRDREQAIRTAICNAQKGDIVLLAGKGHEKYQEIKNNKLEFNDSTVAEKYADPKECEIDKLSFPIDPLQLEFILKNKIIDSSELVLEHISTDSRTIEDNSLFFALQGENFDGHDYVDQVLKKNNCWAVVSQDYQSDAERLIRVEDTLQAFGNLAKKFKSLFKITTIAITGSFGKTTTKEYLYNILSKKALKTFSNENNLIGLPKTIFRLNPEYEYAILELGSNQFGEVARLTEISDPDIAVVTAIGPSHLEFLIDEEGVFKEKSALLKHNVKLRLFPADDNRFKEFTGKTFGSSDSADYRISNIENNAQTTRFCLNDKQYSIPTPFKKFTLNAAIAITLASEIGISDREIQDGLDKPLDLSLRMEITISGNRTLLIDCYNANPDSMKAAIEFWSDYEINRPHVAILGDMLELGKLTEKLHLNIRKLLNNFEYNQLISVGEYSVSYGAEKHFGKVEDLISSGILKDFPDNAIILLKASHGISLEKIIGRI
ncbi:MAG: UDP-N-acetylmuramoyl-L-alanyl-D-glutamate--2,6-diaminopimelate ligase [Candidatus Cloacimonetes bacterium]|nr:UDP-N-acetylmuramoyl-L-alanyl-D-glutamate--2,6-diaminopimelate ligase [Candidatus Cloacimonadota bacterium]